MWVWHIVTWYADGKDGAQQGRYVMSEPEPKNPVTTVYVGNSGTMVFHLPGCPIGALTRSDKRVEFDTAAEAVDRGYEACRNCIKNIDIAEQDVPRETGSTIEMPRLGMMGIIAVILSIAAVAAAFIAGGAVSNAAKQGASEGEHQGYEDGRRQGWEAATAAGYEVGYREGDEAGYADGLVRGAEEGAEKGYAEGYTEGYADGTEEGRILGWAAGQEAGETDGRPIGAEDGYADGYVDGFEEGVGDDYLVRNPTYDEVLEILEGSYAYNAKEMIAEFEGQGIRTGFVWVSVADTEVPRYRWVAFDTVDNGVIFVEAQSRKEIMPEVDKRVSDLFGQSAPDFDDTIIRIRIAW